MLLAAAALIAPNDTTGLLNLVCERMTIKKGKTLRGAAASYSKENLAIFEFELTAGDMTKLNAMQL